MSTPRDSLGQSIEPGDVVVYAAGSRTAGADGRVALVQETKKKVKVQFIKGDGSVREETTHSYSDGSGRTFKINSPEWLAAESLVVVTGFKTFKPQI